MAKTQKIFEGLVATSDAEARSELKGLGYSQKSIIRAAKNLRSLVDRRLRKSPGNYCYPPNEVPPIPPIKRSRKGER